MTLTEVSYYSRRFAPVAIIAFLVLLIFLFAFQLLFVYLKGETKTVPLVNNRPNVVISPAFGNIKAPTFKDAKQTTNIKFINDTIDGKPIEASAAATVYFLPKPAKNFVFLPKIYLMAKENGIDTNVTKHQLIGGGNIARFSDGLRTFDIDITNFNFNYQSTITKENTTFVNNDGGNVGSEITPQNIELAAVEYLRKLDRYPQELAQGKKNIIYMRFNQEANQLVIVNDIHDANMAEVDFHRPDLNGMPVMSPKYFNSPHYVVVAFTDGGLKVVRSQVSFFEKSSEQIGTYPLKTGEQAWSELEKGNGYIVSGNAGQEVSIKKMLLGYLDIQQHEEYLQPVFAFLGDNDFVAYVPAIDSKYLGE